jgi:cardiolipin synthase
MEDIDKKMALAQNEDYLDKIADETVKAEARLLYSLSESPAYICSETTYLPLGELMFERLLEDVNRAKKFIFLEYFIYRSGKMFDALFKALAKKAEEGLEVVVIYDAFGYSPMFDKFEDYQNINIYSFNPYTHSLYNYISFRDHRKSAVIDGKIAYFGGINISDEYINEFERFGHWKDMALRVEGEAVFSAAVSFLKMLSYITRKEIDFKKYREAEYKTALDPVEFNGVAIPYSDGPTNPKNPAEGIYKKIVASAKKYIYIVTPYLDIDAAFIELIKLAAQSGADARVVVPAIPDKPLVHRLSRSYYSELSKGGVKIYEYTPGFVHGKVVVSDDRCAIVGSINMNYRSLAWNYENAVYIAQNSSVISIREDFLDICGKSQEVDYSKYAKENLFNKIYNAALRLLAPLM